MPALRAREAAAIRKLQVQESRRGPKGTSKEDQDLFDALARTYPIRWEGSNMVVSDSVVIKPPYSVESCGTLSAEAAGGLGIETTSKGKGGMGVERIRKVLKFEKEKLELKAAKFNVGVLSGGPQKESVVRKGG